MRITIYLRDLYLEGGGIARLVLDLCDYLARSGCDTTLATWDARDVPAAWSTPAPGRPRLVLIRPPGPLGMFDPALTRQLTRLVDESDVLHMHVPWDPSVARLASIARRRDKPYILTPNGMLDRWCLRQGWLKKQMYLAVAGRRILRHAACIHCASRAELDQTRPLHPNTPGAPIPCLLDLEQFRALPGPDAARRKFDLPADDAPNILFFSRLHYKKRPELLIRAAAVLRDRAAPFRLLIAGPGEPDYLRTLESLVRECGLAGQARFLGMVTREFKASLYQACDVMVLPTSQENFGIVYFESLACATPVITTTGTDTWTELRDSGGAAIIDDRGDEDLVRSLADTLAGLLADRPRLVAMGKQGRRWVLDHLDPASVVAQYVQMYRRAIDGAAAPGGAT